MKKILALTLSIFIINTSYSQWSNKSFTHGGIVRNYRIYVPAIYNSSNQTPLLIGLHGLGDNMTNFSGIGMNLVADTANFICVFPEAVNDANFGTAWNSGAGAFGIYPNSTVNDLDFIRCLMDTISSYYNINQNRIYAFGFSMGAFMANRIVCQMPNKVAAIASVAGTIGSGYTCAPSKVVPVCHFHGTADATISYTNNTFGMNPEPMVNYWVNNNSCATTPTMTTLPDVVADGYNIEHFKYKDGNNAASEVEFYKVYNAPHTWLFEPNNDISYTKEIWKFFRNKVLVTNVGIQENTSVSGNINVFPNPVNSFLNVKSENNPFTSIEIYNVSGQMVKIELFSDSQDEAKMEVNDLENGFYFVKLKNSKNQLIGVTKVCISK